MLNDDWHTHRLELNTETGILLVDGEISDEITYKFGSGNVGITFYLNEQITSFTWHFNTLNSEGVRYNVEIKEGEVNVAHDFNEHPQTVFIATTYLMVRHVHFIKNLN